MQSLVPLEFLRVEVLMLKYLLDGSGALMAFNPNDSIPKLPPGLAMAVREIEAYRQFKARGVMVNVLRPGIVVPMHSDPDPVRLERWHLPIVTNADAFWSDGSGERHLEAGWWHGPMAYWEPHQVGNRGLESRCHLIVDLK